MVRQEASVLFVWEQDGERESEVGLALLVAHQLRTSSEVVSIVTHIIAESHPSRISVLCFLLRV